LNVRASTVARNTGLGGAGGLGSVPVRNGSNGSGRGGVTHNSGTATMRNSIAALNSGIAGPDVAGAFTSEGYNFIGIGDTASGFTGPADQVGTTGAPFDPGLGSLQNNGGPTDTLGLLPGPAIDAGYSFGLTSDQRGHPRPSDYPLIANAPGGDGTDIGAFESRAVVFVTTLDDHDDGTADEFDCSLREAINAANADAGDQAIRFRAIAHRHHSVEIARCPPSVSRSSCKARAQMF
jgi:CSLREA domain-containing protein